MKIVLEKKEAEDMFYNSLCNGLNELSYYGLQLSFFDADYTKAAKKLKKTATETVCYEDVLMQILRDGKKLSVIDHEMGGDYSVSIDLNDVHERVALTPIRHLMDAINENDDAITADCILQSVFFKEVVFG
jgi:hypothetical protein